MHYSWQHDNWNQLQVHHIRDMVHLKTFYVLDHVSDIADPNWVLDLNKLHRFKVPTSRNLKNEWPFSNNKWESYWKIGLILAKILDMIVGMIYFNKLFTVVGFLFLIIL